jgi:tetratricopeptide (TPR) repeat protein
MASRRPDDPGVSGRSEAVGLDAYVPLGLARRLSGEGDVEVWFDGAVLVADIAGYSELTERSSARGEEGVEELSALLSAAFREALGVIDAHGGEVVYFAGDALVCYWEGHSAGDTADRVATCGRELLELASQSSSELGLALRFHVSVASGPLWAARIGGGSGLWDLLFGGPVVRSAFAGLRHTGAGQIRVSSVEDLGAAQVRPQSSWTASSAVSPGDLLPSAVARRALDDQWTTEMRRVECLFVRLANLDESRLGELARFRKALFLVHDTLKTASATGRLVIDDGGLTVVWVMGEPAGNRGGAIDSPLELAARLQHRLRLAGFEASAGMAAGRAFCGSFGTSRRREIVAVGAPMVLAARLMAKADGTLLVAGSLAGPGVGFTAVPLAPLQIKGFARQVSVSRIEVSGERDLADTLVGRQTALAAIEARFDGLAAGRGGVCVVTGSAGLGKSSIIRALEIGARLRGIAVSVGEAHGAERAVPYFAWRAIFRAAFADLALDDPDRLRIQLAAQVSALGKDPSLVTLLGVVFPLRSARDNRTPEMAGADRAAATRDLLLSLLASRLPARQMIVLEDLHDMDSTSLGLLEAAKRRFTEVLFVATSRLPCVSDVAQGFCAEADLTVALGALEPEDVARLADVSFGMKLAAAVAVEICAKARGIPLYILAYLRKAHEAAPSTSRATPIADLPPGVADLTADPDPVRGVLGRFVEDLSAAAGRIMKAASVIGERFTPTLLAKALGSVVGAEDLQAVLAAMVGQGILRSQAGGDDAHQFAHALIQEACYETIPGRQRRALHGQVAAALARGLGSDEDAAPDDLIIALAHHHVAAADHVRVVHFAESAALRVRRQGAYREAIRLLDRCLESAANLPLPPRGADGRVRWLRLKAEAAGAIGDRDGRQRDAESAIALSGAREPRSRAGSSIIRLLTAATRGPGRLVPTRAATHGDVDLELAQIYRQLAIAAYFAGQALEIVYNASAALHHARRAGRSPELADALASMGTCLGLIGFSRAGRRYLRAAGALAEELRSDPAIVYAHLSNALFLMGLGDWKEVASSIETCQETCLRTGNQGDWANAQALRFWMHHYQGDTRRAQEAADTLHDAATNAENPQHQSWAARFRALCLARSNRWDLVAAQLEAARDLLALATDNRRLVRPLYELVPVIGDLAAARFELGDRDGAQALFSNALEAFLRPRRPAGHAVLEGYGSLARVAFARYERGGAASDLTNVRHVLSLLGRYSRVFPIGRPLYSFWRGRLASLSGKRRAARSILTAGLESAERLGMRNEALSLSQARDGGRAEVASSSIL